ncbi:hypothetical protein N7481_005013 [Penicillium waksmanii]|uniref:uncharacterized protein n=1 Tax=Penicillium waksmanii TaxID=69791 RepID=UPI00254751B5|nr:uncharacterized protein N7481_005013 [Penicillium waksmanii]KAJ5982914.1 hypothetical protein N7481_005013 [Penicillium waksmanii]
MRQKRGSEARGHMITRALAHGNDLDDGAVSGPFHHGETGDSPVVASSPPLNHPPLSDDGSAPPSPAQRVIEHENAGSPQRRDPGFRIVKSSSHSQVPLESLPNGMCRLNSLSSRSNNTPL